MRNFQDTFETRKRSSISAFSFCITLPLICYRLLYNMNEGINSLGYYFLFNRRVSLTVIFNSVYLWGTNFNCNIVTNNQRINKRNPTGSFGCSTVGVFEMLSVKLLV